MGKALVLKDVDFATNKLDTVTYGDIVPCTALSLSQNTISFSAIDATVTLTATKTPANTTDELTWSSSNENCATVADGLVTCVGVGSATISVTCGSQSATCSVSSTLTIVPEDTYYTENGAYYSGSMQLPTKNGIGRATSTRGRLFYSTTEYGQYRVFVLTENAGKYAIPIPKGTTHISIKPPDGMETSTSLILANVNEKQTYVTGQDGNAALGLLDVTLYSSTTFPYDVDISDYPTANGFIFSCYAPSGTAASSITAKSQIVFS